MREMETIDKVVFANNIQRAVLDKNIPASCIVIISAEITKGNCVKINVETKNKKEK